MQKNKTIIYQVFTRLFGNTNASNIPWGTIEENGVGKFNDFTNSALKKLKELGTSHIWYTGVLHHALINDYTSIGISNDKPEIVKGRAGSPYAIKDYYNVNPDLATDPSQRLEEFESLIKRTHENGMKVIIDIVPNHVARHYHSVSLPENTEDFGANDNKLVEYDKNNNFYYIQNDKFKLPSWLDGYQPLGGRESNIEVSEYIEQPAKWTGNGSRSAQPGYYDWYETVKVNYGVKPDGTYDFDLLPHEYSYKPVQEHVDFWKDKEIPNSWIKFRDIALYWINKGVDGFRYDMAEMVPIEFWSFMNASIKSKSPQAFLMAEVYQPHLYRDYILKGKMDYLYDKIDLYDCLKSIIQGNENTDRIAHIQRNLNDIEHNMLHFLENHDEQRIASPEFAGDSKKGKPMMVVSATISTSPTMIYFAQELGEKADLNAGFGSNSRTSIFDYCAVPSLQAWVNEGKYDGGQSTSEELELRDFYKTLLSFTANSSALMGNYEEIHEYNKHHTSFYNDKLFSFVRWSNEEKLIIISNFSKYKNLIDIKIPSTIIDLWKIENGNYKLTDILTGSNFNMVINNKGVASVLIESMDSLILSLNM